MQRKSAQISLPSGNILVSLQVTVTTACDIDDQEFARQQKPLYTLLSRTWAAKSVS